MLSDPQPSTALHRLRNLQRSRESSPPRNARDETAMARGTSAGHRCPGPERASKNTWSLVNLKDGLSEASHQLMIETISLGHVRLSTPTSRCRRARSSSTSAWLRRRQYLRLHHHHSLNFRKTSGEMMRYGAKFQSLLREAAASCAAVRPCGKRSVPIAGHIQQKNLRPDAQMARPIRISSSRPTEICPTVLCHVDVPTLNKLSNLIL